MTLPSQNDMLYFTEDEIPKCLKEPHLTLSCLALSLITTCLVYASLQLYNI